MKIDFPVMSMLAVLYAAFFLACGGTAELYSLQVNFAADAGSVAVSVDPAFRIYSDQVHMGDAWGRTFGNVFVVSRSIQNTLCNDWVTRFEMNHVLQYRALGWWQYPAKWFVPIDPLHYQAKHLDDPSEADEVEWLPPDGWVDIWHFISFNMDYR